MFEDLFEQVDKHLRSAAIAEIGGFRPDREGIHSWFGGNFHMLPGELWPKHNSRDMAPVIQIRVDEMPVVPHQMSGFALITLFVAPDSLPIDIPSENGDGWLIRTYPTLDKLEPRFPNEPFSTPRPFQIKWHLQENDGPDWYDIVDLIDISGIGLRDEFREACRERYQKYHFTKVGGWASTIQGPEHRVDDPFVLQVASEEKPNWGIGDSGSMYFFLHDSDRWTMYWDCF
jgi:hypothetical protein